MKKVSIFWAVAIVLTLALSSFNAWSQDVGGGDLPQAGADGAMQMMLPEVPQPGITAALTNTTQLSIVITNGVDFANYEVYRRIYLNSGPSWVLNLVGEQGQTNFVADMGDLSMSFFRVYVGNDWDGDGIPNFMDADAIDPNTGVLSITIENPLHGAVIE